MKNNTSCTIADSCCDTVEGGRSIFDTQSSYFDVTRMTSSQAGASYSPAVLRARTVRSEHCVIGVEGDRYFVVFVFG